MAEVRVTCDSAVSPPRDVVVYIPMTGRQDVLSTEQGTVGNNACMG